MKSDPTNDALRRLLHEHRRADPPANPSFRDAVWRRLEADAQPSSAVGLPWPRLGAYASLTLLAAGSLGGSLAWTKAREIRQAQFEAYVQAVGSLPTPGSDKVAK